MTRRRGRPPLPVIEDLATHPQVWVTPRQLAPYWGYHWYSVRRWCIDGTLKAAKFPGGWKVRTTDAYEFEARLFPVASRNVPHGTLVMQSDASRSNP